MIQVLLFVPLMLAIRRPHWEELPSYTFDQYLTDFEKSYSQEEYSHHKENFYINLAKLIESNNDHTKTYKSTVSDSTDGSSQMSLGSRPTHSHTSKKLSMKKFLAKDLPKEVDWRKQEVVSPIKDQGNCGSCWAFTTIEVLESHLAIATGKMTFLSAQHLVGCSKNNQGCGGTGGCDGSVTQAGLAFTELFGLVEESAMPYEAKDTGCKWDAQSMKFAVSARGYEKIPHNDQDAIMWHLAYNGPLGISVWANDGWKGYQSGVFNGCDYSENMDMNHAVTLVGYGTDPELGDYWIVRNHWGTTWGEDGYIRIKRDSVPQCGIDSTPGHGSACVGDGQTEQKVCGQCGIIYEAVYPIGVDAA